MKFLSEIFAEKTNRYQRYSMTLIREDVEELRKKHNIINLSGWVQEKMRTELMNGTVIFVCACGVEASALTWAKWKAKCPDCGKTKAYKVKEDG